MGLVNAVVTVMEFPTSPERTWSGLIYYEQITGPSPLLLRLFLPRPIRTEGKKGTVGDETRCLYASGYLVKRVTRLETARHYGFEVIEQGLTLGGGIRLVGGSYSLRSLGNHHTEVALESRYVSPQRPRWLSGPIEAAVCHAFHRHLLRTMRRTLAATHSGQPPDGNRPGAQQ